MNDPSDVIKVLGDIFNHFQDYILGFGEITVALAVGILAYNVALQSNRREVARERLEKAYSYLFRAIEPYLYKDISLNDWDKFLDVFEKINKEHYILIEPHLRDMVNTTTKVLSNESSLVVYKKDGKKFTDIVCDIISKDYDKLCKQSYLPKRNLFYILDNKQYKSWKHGIGIFIRLFGLPIIFYIIMVILVFKLW